MHATTQSRTSTGFSPDLLAPLTCEEIERAAALIRAREEFGEASRFVAISVAEPTRGTTETGSRSAEVIIYDRMSRATSEFTVDLGDMRVVAAATITGVEPAMSADEVLVIERSVRNHPPFQEALRRRGIEDASLVDVFPVPMGFDEAEGDKAEGRLARFLVSAMPYPGGNAHARPIDGLFGIIDLNTGEVVSFEDRRVVPLPDQDGEYRADHVALRTDVRPIHITQPEGTSFTVDGYEVRWQKWRFLVGFNSREGLVLHQIRYNDDGELRSILHRASYAEMIVPYADPEYFFQAPLDIGEFNIGTLTNSLTLGCDCLGAIHYFDVAVADSDGRPVRIPNAICLHEEDDGLLWKHTDFRTGRCEVRRSRRLVISSVVTVGNYDYGFFWYLHQDGVISSEVKATGIVSAQAVPGDKPTRYGELVAPGVNAINHQHIFCVRLDFDLDGGPNSVAELNSESIPIGPDNPHGNAWISTSETLDTELSGRRHSSAEAARSWVVVNPSRCNVVGEQVGYRLVPGDNTVPFAAPGSSVRRRAGFINYQLWVTPYSPDERYPAGNYPYQHEGDDGLPRWVKANRSIRETDLVVWYTMNHHHIARPEDWPVMPVAKIGFELKPWGFFDRSPALDVPPSDPSMGCHVN